MATQFQANNSDNKNVSFIEHFTKLHIKPQGLNTDPAQTPTLATNHEAAASQKKKMKKLFMQVRCRVAN